MARRTDTSLAEYRRKRRPDRTPEPPGERASSAGGRSFVIQKHAATRLHYDFRLEHAGALLSWAVPKGPSLDPAVTRLAVRVEDHPVSYGDFEGVIPAGEYGGGTVLLWDRGTWRPDGDPAKGLARGKLHFTLEGEKLTGRWLLVRTGRGEGDRGDWLLRKEQDEAARPEEAGAITDERPESVASGRDLEEIARDPERVWSSKGARRKVPSPEEVAGAVEAPLPRRVAPQLATLVERAPPGEEWLHEIKLDGYRILLRVEEGRARVLTRNGKDWSDRLAPLVTAAAYLPVRSALLDGEAVWLADDGGSDFAALQKALGEGRGERLYGVLFDLLHLDGWDLAAAPLVERKRLLEGLLSAAPAEAARLRYSGHVAGQGEAFHRQACRMALEGTIAKRADAPYRPGRGREWVKVKCQRRQELVIVGFTDPQGSRAGFGALVLAVHDGAGGPLLYAGKVGTGFDDATLVELRRTLEARQRDSPPLASPPRELRRRGVHWVEPDLVAEVRFTEWTTDGRLRHPSFVALRSDKPAREIVRESPEPPPAEGSPKRPAARPAKAARRPSRPRITNPSRVLWPADGITKGDYAAYVESVAERMLPHVAGRPLTLLRCPEGIGGDCFYQKHLREAAPAELETVPIVEREGKEEPYLVARSPAALVALAQLGVLEIHVWGSRVEHLERPDRLVFDLDPDPGIGWPRVVDAAHRLRDILAGLGLASLPLLTGGKGIHLVVPVEPRLEWEAAKAFCRAVAELLARDEPDRFTLNLRKRQRKGRIFIDFLRNAYGSTAIAPFSTRARPGAPVATPVRWDEVVPGRRPDHYHLRNLRRRLAALASDPWEGMAPQELPPEVLEHLGAGDG